jgi:proteic killer suppression protein
MRISFISRRLAKACSIHREMRTAFGSRMADVLASRLQDLEAARTLATISRLPPCRCHELKGNRKGQLAIDLVHPHRLIFVPDHDPEPLKDDGGLDWARVSQILVVEVGNYH